MKTLMLTLSLAWAGVAHADVAVPSAVVKTWAQRCADKLDAKAKLLRLQPGARVVDYPLLDEQGRPQPVTYVEWASDSFKVAVGKDADGHADERWTSEADLDSLVHDSLPPNVIGWFRRLNHRFARIDGEFSESAALSFKAALDECLKMGDSK